MDRSPANESFRGRVVSSRLALCLLALAWATGTGTRADVVFLDETWSVELLRNEVAATETDTARTGDPTQTKSGVCSVMLENKTGWPSIRFRNAARARLQDLPVGKTEARLWYRTDAWEGKWELQVWQFVHGVTKAPEMVLKANLDGGGESGRLIADDRWHQARGVLEPGDAHSRIPVDRLAATYIWLRPTEGWDIPHRTYVDRCEAVVVSGPLKGRKAPEPARRVRPRPGAQVDGEGWVWIEGEDAVKQSFPEGGPFGPDNIEQQKKLSNGAWLQYHPGAGLTAAWRFEVAEAGRYVLWVRGLADPRRLRWRCDTDSVPPLTGDVKVGKETVIRQQDLWKLAATWVRFGETVLEPGTHTLHMKGLDGGYSLAVDCILLTRWLAYRPQGTRKPE